MVALTIYKKNEFMFKTVSLGQIEPTISLAYPNSYTVEIIRWEKSETLKTEELVLVKTLQHLKTVRNIALKKFTN